MARGGGSRGSSVLGGQSGFSQHRDGGTLRDGVGGVECMGHSRVGSVVRGGHLGDMESRAGMSVGGQWPKVGLLLRRS